MGHLINPIAMRLGWLASWHDSWYSDYVYYPEFLHDVFRLRLYLNFVFYRAFFLRKGLLFSHFEIFFKYNFLLVRLFYYDSLLMEGVFLFDAELANSFFRRSFYYLQKRRRLFEKSRYVTFFLGVFSSFFSFTDFFRRGYLKSFFFDNFSGLRDLDYNFRKKEKPRDFLAIDRQRRFYRRNKIAINKIRDFYLAKIVASASKAKGRPLLRRRLKRQHSFASYHKIFGAYSGRKRVSVYSKKHYYKLVSLQEKVLMHVDDIIFNKRIHPMWPHFLRRGWISLFRRMRIGKIRFHRFNAPWYHRRFYRFLLQKVLRRMLFYAGPGNFDKLLSVFFYSIGYKLSPFKLEFKFFMLFFFLFKKVWVFLRQGFGWVYGSKERKRNFIRAIFLNASFLFFFRSLKFSFFSSFMACIIKFLIPTFTCKVAVFLLSNDSLTARFLATFIAKRLVQGYSLRQVLSPVLKDLYTVALTTNMPKSFFATRTGLKGHLEYRKSFLKSFIVRHIFIYKQLFFRSYKHKKNWFSFALLAFFFYFRKRLRYVFRFRRVKYKKMRLLGVSKRFFLQRASFLFFFNYDFSMVVNNFSYVFNEIFYLLAFGRTSVASIYFFFIIDDIFSNFNVIFFRHRWTRLFLEPFMLATVFFNRLVSFNYGKYYYNWLIAYNRLNKLHLRIRHRGSYERSNLLGYKVHLKGRFSRKQRASSIWFIKGLVPLNTLTASIDYSFYGVPLRNSLVSIKVWLYKDVFYPKWFIRHC